MRIRARLASFKKWLAAFAAYLTKYKAVSGVVLTAFPSLSNFFLDWTQNDEIPIILTIAVGLSIIIILPAHFQLRVWGLEIEPTRPWTSFLADAEMHQEAVIRAGSHGSCSVSLEWVHGIRVGSWNLRFEVTEAAVIQDFEPKGRRMGDIKFHPSVKQLGEHSVLCVHRKASNNRRIPASLEISLSNEEYPTGTRLILEIFGGYNLNIEKCRRCQASKCKHSDWKMKKIETISILVVPPARLEVSS